MLHAVDRLLALDRALGEVRFAELLLRERLDVPGWGGAARDAFADAAAELPGLLRTASAALERERDRTRLEVWTG